ncbi:MAG: hypothetical protein RIF34_03050, partial [Candidatus Kapaibacterium sp.]
KFIGLNLRGSLSGGKPYLPVLLKESIDANREIRDNNRSYTRQLPAYVGVDFSINYKWIRPSASHEVKVDVFRLFEQNYYDEVYVPEKVNRDGSVSEATLKQIKYGEGQTASTLLPVIYYKLTF